MKILLTGATGYIGKRLLPALVEQGHHVVCCTRDLNRFHPPSSMEKQISAIQVDLLDQASLRNIPRDIDAAYYLVHSMSSAKDYKSLEQQSAVNFRDALEKTNVKQVIYLGGIVNEATLSEHLSSRLTVEKELEQGAYAFTALRAGIIIGSGSASFEIIRDLVEKLPVMIAPKWLRTKCQPVAIADVIAYLTKALGNKQVYDKNFDIGCHDILTYKEMLLQYAEVRNLKRRIWIVPVMTPKLSSYWLYFVTSTSYKLARSLVDSMKVEVVCRDDKINHLLNIEPISYKEALRRAFSKIENNEIVSSWKDAYISSGNKKSVSEFIKVPQFGCFVDQRKRAYQNRKKSIEKLWSIGGKNGWYYATWLWKLRGFIDKVFGGVGLRRGRTNQDRLSVGDSLDFWRVLYSNKNEGHLLLYAEMKLPGEAWLEWKLEDGEVVQTATFRPLGILGRLYWYLVLPFHGFIFKGMLREVTEAQENKPES